MAKKALPTLTGGLNELTRNDLIGDSQLQISDNYEVIGDGTLKLRKDSETYSTSLDTLIGEIYEDVTVMAEPYYPQRMIETPDLYAPTEDFLLIFFGLTINGLYEMHIVFKYLDAGGDEIWTQYVTWDDNDTNENTLNDLLTNQDITFNSTAEPQFTMGSDRIIITDGKNKAFYIRINSEGRLQTSTLGIEAPQNRPHIDPILDTGVVSTQVLPEDIFTTNAEASRVGTPGLFQCVYTVVDEYGQESNPSPISPTIDLQFFKLDADNIDERWVSGVRIQDLNLPTVGIETAKTLKHFRIYHRIHRYSENLIAKNFEFAQDFLIKKRFKDDGTANDEVTNTGNDYIISVEVSPGDIVSYEKDVAPIAKKSSELSGVIMLGNVRQDLKIPWDFKHTVPIEINNLNSSSYVDALVHIKLTSGEASGPLSSVGIENLSLSDYWLADGPTLVNKQHIRIFDQDLTTPLYVASTQRENNLTMDTMPDETDVKEVWLSVMIPLLPSYSKHTIYLAWNPYADMSDNGGDYTGVPDKYNDIVELDDIEFSTPWDDNIGIHYGRFYVISLDSTIVDDDDRNEIFHFDRVKNDKTILTSFFGALSGGVNKANNTHTGDLQYTGYGLGGVPAEGGGQRFPTNQYNAAFNPYFGSQNFIWNTGEDGVNEYFPYGSQESPFNLSLVDNKSTVFFWYTFNDLGLSYSKNYTIFSLGSDLEKRWRFGYRHDREGGESAYPIIMNSDGDIIHSFDEIEMLHDNVLNENAFFCVSWNDSIKEIDVFFFSEGHEASPGWQSAHKEYDDAMFDDDVSIETMNVFFIGDSTPLNTNVYHNKVTGVSMMFDYYVENLSQAIQIANTMPIYGENNEIGTIWLNSYDDAGVTDFSLANIEDFNNNISFGKVELIEGKERKNMLKWSEVNSQSFPDLNFKRLREPIVAILPAPSFLQFDYKNTFLIFTRNTINRFVLSGTPDGWSGSVSSLIEEKTQYGLLAEKSLIRAGESIFWLSESGVMMWNKDGMKLISKNIVNVPIEDGAVGFYSSLRNQYLVQSVPVSGNGDDNGNGDGPESAVWNFGSEIIITQYSNIWIQADSGGNEGANEGPGVMFQIVGYENLLPEGVSDLTFVLPYSHANSLINIINQPLPQDEHLNVWDYWLLDGVPVGGDGSSIPQEYRWIADPSPEFPHAPVLSFAYPDMNLLLYEESLPEVTFTPGTGETNSENIIYNPYFMGDLEWLQIFGVPRDNVYVLGFWNLSIANVLGATLAGHRTTATRTRDIGDFYSYQIDRNIWTKFNNMNAVDTAILTGGNELSNVNLLLNDNNEVLKYPGTSTVSEGKMKTKKMYFEKGVIRRVNLDHLTEDGNTVALKTTMERYNSEGEIMFSDNTITNIKPRKWRGIPLGKNRGRSITFEIENADNIGSIGFDLRVEQ